MGKARFVRFRARRFGGAGEAVQYSEAAGGAAILLDREALVVSEKDADRLAAAGVEFAHLFDQDGRVMSIPVND